MNLLFVFERKIIPHIGGLERVTFLLASELRKRNYNVSFLSVGPKEWNTSTEVFDFPQSYIGTDEKNFSSEFRHLLTRGGIDIIIFQGNHPSVIRALSETPENILKLAVYHNRPFGYYKRERFILKLTPWNSLSIKGKAFKLLGLSVVAFYRKIYIRKVGSTFKYIGDKADKLIFLSERFLPRVAALIPKLDKNKLYAINNPNTFDISEDKSYEDNKKENIVLFVARLSNPQKNVTGFIDVWERFGKRNPEWKAIVLGDGEHRDYILRYARKKKVKNIFFEGNKKNIEEYYRKAKILCLSSTYEGWGMIITEAMAYGCVPVVFDSYEAVRDIINNKIDGLLVTPFDVNEMVKALELLVNDSNLRLKMAERGKSKIKSFEVDKIVDKWEELFRTMKMQ